MVHFNLSFARYISTIQLQKLLKKGFVKTIILFGIFFYNLCHTIRSLDQSALYTEENLVAALKRRENDAFKHLYMNYRGSLYNIILQLITDTEIANDVLQDVIITIWKQIDKYDAAKGKLFTWMVRLTRNAAINKLRSKVYKSQAKNENLDHYVLAIEENNPGTENINQIGLRQQVHQLRKEYTDVIELSYYNGFTQEEISKALDIPLGTVKTRLRSALLELRKQFV
jgi:RNA polymerase sigma-70 factor (ECF subfamily)